MGDWLTGTKATSDVWLGAQGHGYAFRVRARDSKGNAGAWNVEPARTPRRRWRRAGSDGSWPAASRTAPARTRTRPGSGR